MTANSGYLKKHYNGIEVIDDVIGPFTIEILPINGTVPLSKAALSSRGLNVSQ